MRSLKKYQTTFYDISLQVLCKEHLNELAEQLRLPDRKEMWACYHLPVRAGLEVCARRSIIGIAFLYRGKVCAVAGVEPISLLGNQACVWSWTGRAVKKCPKVFMQVSRRVLAYFRSLYPHLYAACDERYIAAQKYLLHLGAHRCGKPFNLADRNIKFAWYHWQ